MNYSRQHTIIAVILSSFITTLIIIGIYIRTTPSLKQEFTSLFTKSSQTPNQTFVEATPTPTSTPSDRAEISLEAPSIQQITSQPLVSSMLGNVYKFITSIGSVLLDPLAYISN